jgi:hypothetical protein
MESDLRPPLTLAQTELLRLFSREVPESDWIELRRLIARDFAEKAAREMNEVWDEKGWTQDDMEKLLRAQRSSAPAPPRPLKRRRNGAGA